VESKTGNNARLYNGHFAVVLRATDGEKLLSRSLTLPLSRSPAIITTVIFIKKVLYKLKNKVYNNTI
jgi:hypothetical protein